MVRPLPTAETMGAVLPVEILGIVVDLLASDYSDDRDNPNLAALRSCSLVCRTLSTLCQRHIFSKILIDTSISCAGGHITDLFVDLLSQSPEIADLIRELGLDLDRGTISKDTFPAFSDALLNIGKLRSLRLSLDWDVFNATLQPALIHFLRQPSFSQLSLECMVAFPASILSYSPNLTYLDIQDISLTPLRDSTVSHPQAKAIVVEDFRYIPGPILETEDISNSATLQLMEIKRPDNMQLLDFSQLRSLRVANAGERHTLAMTRVLKEAKHLQELQIHVNTYGAPIPWFEILRDNLPTLKAIRLEVYVSTWDFQHPSKTLPILREFECISSAPNVVESLEFTLCLIERVKPCDGWTAVDNLLCRPGWSALRNVSLKIVEDPLAGSPEQTVSDAWKSLYEQFPRLSSSATINFSFQCEI